VLDPLCGYLTRRRWSSTARVRRRLELRARRRDVRPVASLTEALCRHWGAEAACTVDSGAHPHEARFLKLDCSRAHTLLGWRPLWNLEEAVARTVSWARARLGGADVRGLCIDQIREYDAALRRRDGAAAAAGRVPS
jgi:CDP-glucose 4,6-dehydratase